MAGSKAGGVKASKTNRERYGEDWYRRIGSIGGQNGHTGGFAASKDRAKAAGSKGGKTSRRGWKLIEVLGNEYTYENRLTGKTKTIVID